MLVAQTPPAAVPDWVAVQANVAYDRHTDTVLDVLQPKAPALDKRPGAIVIHGGLWTGGSKQDVFDSLCLPFLQKGFVVANVEYRRGSAAPAPAAIEDVLRAARWFRDNADRYRVDTRRIVVAGVSAGGYLALMVGLAPKSARLGPSTKVAAIINFYGASDVEDLLSGPNAQPFAAAWVPEQQGRNEMARRISPINHVHSDAPAILSIHGDGDPTVPYTQSAELTNALRVAGADAEMIPVQQGGHGNFTEERTRQIREAVFEFLERRDIPKRR